MDTVFVLIHSPLVGPFTWALVEEKLRAKGIQTVRPALISLPDGERPFWKRHAQAVAQSLGDFPANRPVVLIAHSGAGPLLPAIRQAVQQPVAGYLFVDAGWPVSGKSRLDLFGDAEEVEQFRQSATNGLLPTWSDADLAPVIPDDAVRRQFVRELTPLPLAVYEEALPVFDDWPDTPCAYLRFGNNPAYDRSFKQAQQAGCPVMQLEGQHFHVLVDPPAVVNALLKLCSQAGICDGQL